MHYYWYDFVGNVGVALVIIAYLLLQTGRLDSKSTAYSVANAVGAAAVLVSLAYDFNLSAFITEAFWLLLSLVGIARNLRRRPGPPAPAMPV